LRKQRKHKKTDFPSGIGECGTDALRFALCGYTSQGRDINMDIKRVIACRNFCNKLWNAAKLALITFGEHFTPNPSSLLTGKESLVDKWILSRLNAAIFVTNNSFKDYDFSEATSAIHNFWLYEFCDVYLEAVKPIIHNEKANPDAKRAVQDTLYTCMDEGLRLLSPFMPFLCEELWQRLKRREGDTTASICVAQYPSVVLSRSNPKLEDKFKIIQQVIHAIRSLRANYGLKNPKPKTKLILIVHSDEAQALFEEFLQATEVLAYSEDAKILRDQPAPQGCAAAIPNDLCEVYIPLRGLVNIEAEIQKLLKKKAELQKQITSLESKLQNPNYLAKVPQNVKDQDHSKLESLRTEMSNLDTTIERFKLDSQPT